MESKEQKEETEPKNFWETNKILISVITILILIVAGIAMFFVLQKPTLPTDQASGRCGDGICGEKEKANPKLCPEDCADNMVSADKLLDGNIDDNNNSNVVNFNYKDSPFAIQSPYSILNLLEEIPQEKDFIEVNNLLSDIGINWIRLLIPELKNTKELSHEFNIISGISSPIYPKNMTNHVIEHKEIVESYKDDVQAWMIVNEADLNWKDTEENYAKYVIEMSKMIKSVSPNAKVAISFAGLEGEEQGFSAIDLLDSALEYGIGPHFDVLDFHFQGTKGSYKEVSDYVSKYNQVLNEHYIDQKSIWITEYGTYSGDPLEACTPWWVDGSQNENEHASELIKRYIYGVSLNVDKMFWTGIYEWNKEYQGFILCRDSHPYEHYFNYVGLINTPTDADSSSHKKLGYYSYKLMTEKLEGSDWDNIEIIQESNDVYIYKFINKETNKPTWVAWNDNANSQAISLEVGNIESVKITEAVPKYETGKEVTDYNTAFSTEQKNVKSNQISITLEDVPMFIEKEN